MYKNTENGHKKLIILPLFRYQAFKMLLLFEQMVYCFCHMSKFFFVVQAGK